jgi:hypothetical protein
VSNVMYAEDVSDGSVESGAAWRRSSRSYGNGACLEAAVWCGTRVDVRDSKNPQATVLRFTAAQWNAFVAGVRSGAFGL